MSGKKKERVELQFNMESKPERELLDFIDQNGGTRAGFIKSVIRHYMNTIQSVEQNTTPPPKPEKSKQSAPKKKQETPKKKMPKLGSSFSSKDFE